MSECMNCRKSAGEKPLCMECWNDVVTRNKLLLGFLLEVWAKLPVVVRLEAMLNMARQNPEVAQELESIARE